LQLKDSENDKSNQVSRQNKFSQFFIRNALAETSLMQTTELIIQVTFLYARVQYKFYILIYQEVSYGTVSFDNKLLYTLT